MAGRTRLIVGTGVASLALVGSGVIGASGAHAAPDKLKQAKERVDELRTQSAAIDQDALAAQVKLDKAQASLKNRKADQAGQEQKVDSMKGQLRSLALAQYQDRALDPSTRILFSTDSDEFMSRFATIQHVSDSQKDMLQDLQSEQASLSALKRDSEADVATVAEQEKQVKELRSQSQAKLDDAEETLNRLTEEERQRLAEQERREEQKAQAENADADADSDSTSDSKAKSTSTSGSKKKSGSKSDPTAGIPDSDRVGKVLATARAQLGKPYVYAANGPDSFDCSGFTTYAFKSAGVSLPRVSRDQKGVGTNVSRSELKPGDLVFFYSPISHVGIYVGNGKIIHSPRSGKTVSYAPVDQMPWAGATRVL